MQKKGAIFLSSMLAISLFGCAGSTNSPSTAANAESYPDVTIVNWSDFHSAIYELTDKDGKASGGLPVFMSAIENARGDGLSLLIDGGDMSQGAMPFNEAKGMGMIEVMNTLGLDVATIGNHEFDYASGVKYPDSARGSLQEMIESSHFPWVNANVVSAADNTVDAWPYANMTPYKIIEKGPYRIAVIGLLSTETKIATNASNIVGLEFRSPAEALRDILPEVESQKPDFIIVDAHILGLPTVEYQPGEVLHDVPFNYEIGEILALPEDVLSHVDLILSAHSHSSFIAHNGNLTIIQSLANGGEITTMKLSGSKDGLKLDKDSIHKHVLKHEPIDTACGEASTALSSIDVNGVQLMPSQVGADIVAKYEGRMTFNRCDVVGCLNEAIQRVDIGESPIGNLVADAMISHFPGTDAAMINAGGLRIDLGKGTIYRETLNSLMPFDNFLHLVRVRGDSIIRMLKISSSLKHRTSQVAGIEYTIEPNCNHPEDLDGDGELESWENNCLCADVKIQGKPIVASQQYTLAISDFILNGGDDHGACFKNGYETVEVGPTIKETLLNYVQSKEACLSASDLVNSDAPRIKVGSCNGHYL